MRSRVPDAGSASTRRLVACLTALVLSTAACNTADDDTTTQTTASDTTADTGTETTVDATPEVDTQIELRDEIGPHVDAPDRAMTMTVDALDIAADDILVRVRVSNSDDRYLDLGVQDTIYGPLLVMRDDRGNVYEGYAVEPAGIPGHRIADLSFRLAGPLDREATSFTLELATQRGSLSSPSAPLPRHGAVRWRVDEPADAASGSTDPGQGGSEPVYATAPRLPDLIHFWLETTPLPTDG